MLTNLLKKGNLLNEPCLDDTYCNELYGLRCDQASKRCCTKSRGNLINERCLNNDYCNRIIFFIVIIQ